MRFSPPALSQLGEVRPLETVVLSQCFLFSELWTAAPATDSLNCLSELVYAWSQHTYIYTHKMTSAQYSIQSFLYFINYRCELYSFKIYLRLRVITTWHIWFWASLPHFLSYSGYTVIQFLQLTEAPICACWLYYKDAPSQIRLTIH